MAADTYLADLTAARAGAARQLAQLEADALANPQAAYKMTYSHQGQSYDYNGFRAALLDSIERLSVLIRAANPVDFVTVARG